MIGGELWDKCVEFHGHACAGLAIGYTAALYTRELLHVEHAEDEEIVCVSECDACSVDAIQVVLGCSVGTGNLLFHMTGKFAFSFYNRGTGESVRLLLDAHDDGLSEEESRRLYFECPREKMFRVMPTRLELPERAWMLDSVVCEGCGEYVAENYVRLRCGKKLCPDCAGSYDRFHI